MITIPYKDLPPKTKWAVGILLSLYNTDLNTINIPIIWFLSDLKRYKYFSKQETNEIMLELAPYFLGKEEE